MIAPLERFRTNPLINPDQISFTRASGTFNAGATIDRASGRIVLLIRVFEIDTRRSCVALAVSSDGQKFEIIDRPAITRDEPYEEWGAEDARVTWLEEDELYAITYTGFSPQGPRVCLITAEDILDPTTYRRHGPRIAGANKNCVIFPEKVDGTYVILHRPMPVIECIRVKSLDEEWPSCGRVLVGPRPNSWRSSRVGAGAPPIKTDIGWLFPFHGATSIEEGNVYSMGWCVLDEKTPEIVRYVSDEPALTPEREYESELREIPQVDGANFRNGIHVVFPQGLVERGEDLLVYYGAADIYVAGARVNKRELIDSLEKAMNDGLGATPV